LKEQGATEVFSEYIGGAKGSKPELEKLLEIIKAGDTVAVTEVSRLARDVHQLCHVLEKARERRVRLRCGTITLNFDLEDIEPMALAMVQIMGVFAQLERGVTVARINSGIRNAKSKGKKIGRPRICPSSVPVAVKKLIPSYTEGKLSIAAIGRATGYSRQTIYKYLRIMQQDKV